MTILITVQYKNNTEIERIWILDKGGRREGAPALGVREPGGRWNRNTCPTVTTSPPRTCDHAIGSTVFPTICWRDDSPPLLPEAHTTSRGQASECGKR